jgi:hypothetical protein
MNIVRALLRGLVTASIVAGCGSDGGGASDSEHSGLSECATGYTGEASCQTCLAKKCSAELDECYGKDFAGGACEGYAECAKDAEDPCHSDCVRGTECQACITDTLVVCARDSCASECKGALPPPKPTCADLAKCCAMVTFPSAKTGCDGTVSDGNETICASYYASLSALCE